MAILGTLLTTFIGKVFDAVPLKVWLILGLVLMSAYGGYLYRDRIALKELADAQSEQIIKVEKDIVEVERIVTEYIEVKGETKYVYETIYKDAEKVEVDQCVDVGAEWSSMYNAAVIAAKP